MTSPLLNPLYRPPTSESITRGCGVVGKGPGAPTFRAVDVLRPCCEAQGLEIWQAVYMRDNLLLHHRWAEEWGGRGGFDSGRVARKVPRTWIHNCVYDGRLG